MSSQTGLASIMMPAYNAAAYIGPAIESVLAQTYPHWELVIIDDGSTDPTNAVAAQYSDPRIQLFHQSNQGESAARNHALSRLQGEFVAFLDADDQFLPQHLALTVGYLRQHPERDGVYTDGYYLDRANQRQEKLSTRRRGPFEGRIFEQVVRASDVFGPPICTVLRRSTVIQHALTFDTDIVIGPDWDFLTRFTELAEFGYISEATCLYRVHQTNVTLTTNSQRRRLSLARCREKAIRLAGFRACSLETRWYAFYDLLVNLLAGNPARQAAILQSPEFGEMPARERAQLVRLMASRAVLSGEKADYVREWLQLAQSLNPADRRSRLVSGLYRLSPAICQLVLGARARGQSRRRALSPFGALD